MFAEIYEHRLPWPGFLIIASPASNDMSRESKVRKQNKSFLLMTSRLFFFIVDRTIFKCGYVSKKNHAFVEIWNSLSLTLWYNF